MDVRIKIKTAQKEYKGKSIFEHAADELMIQETFDPFDGGDVIETSLYGNASIKNDIYSLKYEESAEGLDGTYTELKFDIKSPKEVSLLRTGALESFMYFEEGKRHVCVYNTGIMPFEICIYSKEVDNKLLTHGYLEIAYLIEIKGACAQKTVFKMEVEKI